MKFLPDVCAASRSLQRTLTELGHEVHAAHARSSDETLLATAYQEGMVLITEDKDFGELVFLRHRPHPCIIRLVEMQVSKKVAAVQELIDKHSEALRTSAIIVVTKSRVRIRPGTHRN